MWPVKTPTLIKFLFPSLTWNFSTEKKELFLTFDDGPDPLITPEVLDMLNKANAKATFFCVGENVKKHPAIFNRITEEGHSVGNHTYNHFNGWKTFNKKYFENVEKCDQLMNSKLFRPPYGKLTFSQIHHLKKKYKIIMWDVLTFDFKAEQLDQCYVRAVKYAKPGSIILFHDSRKAKENVLTSLPLVLEHFSKEGYAFRAIH